MDNLYETNPQNIDLQGFREAVCIDAFRIYDSCADKDCIEDMRVYFTEEDTQKINAATSVRIKDADILTVYMDMEPIPFQKGFYSISMTFFFEIRIDVHFSPVSMPITLSGLSLFEKKVILYGSEGNVKIFSSNSNLGETDSQNIPARNLPKATCQVAQPIALSAKLCEYKSIEEKCKPIPECVSKRFGSNFFTGACEKIVLATLGVFSIVQIERSVQMLIPAYDFCIPKNECISDSDDPCKLFNQIEFPKNEFFPPKSATSGKNCK